MIYPEFLRPGDTIGVVAPSLMVTEGPDKNRFRNAVSTLSEKGIRVRFTDSVFSDDEEKSPAGTRVSELEEVFRDGTIRLISLAKGGYGESEIVGILDWDVLRDNPKWMQGYSDNTILLFKYTVECDVATLYGGNFGDFGMSPWHKSVVDDFNVLTGRENTVESYDYHETRFHERVTGTETVRADDRTAWASFPDDFVVHGRMIGGCMDVLKWLMDTGNVRVDRFIEKYREDSMVWYMETYDMSCDEISAFFSGMEKEGWLEDVSCFIFGRPLCYRGDDYVSDLSSMLAGYGVPMAFNADIGHLAPRMPIVNGAMAEVSVSGGRGRIRYSFD